LKVIHINGIPKTIMIKNTNFFNVWALACHAVSKYGVVVPSGPNYTSNPEYVPPLIKEVRACIEHGEDSINQMLNMRIPPLYMQHEGIQEYINQLTPGTKEFEHGRTFHYTYGLRLREMRKYYKYCDWTAHTECTGYINYNKCEYYNEGKFTANECYIDQLQFISEHLDPFNKRLEAITWIPEIDLPSTIKDENKRSVPCLQQLHIENYYDKYYTIVSTWRSRDLYKAHPWNMVGLVNTIDKLIQATRERLGLPKLKLVQVVEFIDSLHIYENEWDQAKKVPVDAKAISNCLFI